MSTRFSRRHFLSAIALLAGSGAAGAALSACGATPAPAATQAPAAATQAPAAATEAPTAAQATEATAAPAAAGGGAVTIRWLDWSDQDDIINAAIAKLKEKHPNVTVNFEPIGDQWGDKQLTQMVSGNAPDLLTGNDQTSYIWAEKNQLLDLNPLVDRDLTSDQIADFFEYQWNGLLYPGNKQRMGLPYYTWIYQYYINLDAFAEAGLTPPKAGWKLDDYDLDLTKLTKKDDSGKVTRWGGMDNSYDPFRFEMWLRIFGGNMVDPNDWTKCVLNTKEAKDAFEWHRVRLFDKNTLIQQTQVGQLTNMDPIATEKVAIMGEGNGNEGLMLDNPPKFKWACVAPPIGPTGKAQGIGTIDNWGIWKGTKAPDVVWDLLKIVAVQDDFQLAFAAKWVATPNRKSLLPKFAAAVKAKYKDATDDQIQPQLDLLTSGAVQIGTQFKKHKASLEIINPAMEQILRTGTAKPDILDSVADQVTKLNQEA